MTTHERTDIVVIGGGLTGASVSYALARAGARVIYAERSFPAAGPSGACFSVDISSRKSPRRSSTSVSRRHANMARSSTSSALLHGAARRSRSSGPDGL